MAAGARDVSGRAATWLLLAAFCAGMPTATWLFVVVVAPLWAHVAVMLSASDMATFGVIALQAALYGVVLYGLAWAIARGVRRLPHAAHKPVLAGVCVASLLPLCVRSYAICYSSCQQLTAWAVVEQLAAQ